MRQKHHEHGKNVKDKSNKPLKNTIQMLVGAATNINNTVWYGSKMSNVEGTRGTKKKKGYNYKMDVHNDTTVNSIILRA